MQGRLVVLCLSALLWVTSAGAQTTQKTTTQKTTTTTKKSPSSTSTKTVTPQKTEVETSPPPPAPPVVENHEPPAPAARSETELTVADEPRHDRLLAPGDIDARLTLNAEILLAFVNAGVGVDVGVLRLGPGVLAIGGEFEVGVCFTFCLALDALTRWQFSNLYLAPHARATYHWLPLQKNPSPGLEKVDLYGLVFAGATITTTRVAGGLGDSAFEYVGSDVGPSFGLGVGGKYFVQERFFLGAEARLRYSAGTYSYTARLGHVSLSDEEAHWSLSGLNIQFFGGLRL